MSYLIAGYVAEDVYDKMEYNLNELHLEIIDTDGSRLILEKT